MRRCVLPWLMDDTSAPKCRSPRCYPRQFAGPSLCHDQLALKVPEHNCFVASLNLASDDIIAVENSDPRAHDGNPITGDEDKITGLQKGRRHQVYLDHPLRSLQLQMPS